VAEVEALEGRSILPLWLLSDRELIEVTENKREAS
jgi:hypothetical protein